MILSLTVSREQRKALLTLYPSVKSFLQKTLTSTADKLIMENQIEDIEKELNESHERQALNEGVEWVKGTPFWRNRKHSQATKDKIKKTLKEKYQDKHYPLFEETKELIGLGNKGKVLSQETKDAIGKGNTGKIRTEEQRQNISKGHTGLKYKKKVACIT